MDRKERLEENEKLFREVNERVAQLQESFRSGADPEWICECGDETCFDRLEIELDEYREVRSHRDWFVITPGHDKAEVERVVRQTDGYAVVEKFDL